MELLVLKVALPHKFAVFLISAKSRKGVNSGLMPRLGFASSSVSNAQWDTLFRNTHERSCHFKQINRCQLWDYM